MQDGKKGTAQTILYNAFDIIAEKTGREPMEVFEEAIENIMPVLEVKARRIGGSTYQVPIDVKPDRGQALASQWIIEAARKRGGKSMAEKLAGEIVDAYNSQGGSFRRKEDMHRMAEANRTFAHFRF